MTQTDLIRLRLINQQIALSEYSRVKDVVSWMGAMQAQDFPMSRWAVGLRLPGSTETMIRAAIDDGEILRSHLLRPTWHLVSSEDIFWMIELTAPHIINSMRSRHIELGITENVLKKTFSLISNVLEEREYLSREEILLHLRKNKIQTDLNRASHLLFSAELAGILSSGKIINNKHTYALLNQRVKRKKVISREQALMNLAKKYFQSHSPACLSDFTWWSGLPVKEARFAIDSIRQKLISVKIDSIEYFISEGKLKNARTNGVYLLPAYDEYIISYKNRTHLLNSDDHKKVIFKNGFFNPVIVSEGKITGTWKRSVKKEIVYIEISLFHSPDNKMKSAVESAAEEYGKYLKKEIRLVYVK